MLRLQNLKIHWQSNTHIKFSRLPFLSALIANQYHFTGYQQCLQQRSWRHLRCVGKHMIPRMADRYTHDRAAAAIWLHEKP